MKVYNPIGILILLVIACIIIYHIIVYIVLPILGVLAVIAALFVAVGTVYGVGLSCYNFIIACGDNIFKRTLPHDSAHESFFYWQGDWYLNLIDTCTATWNANAHQAQSFKSQREMWWREDWGTFPAFFCVAVTIAVWIGTILFLPILFVIFGSVFSFVFITYNLLAYSIYGVETVYLKLHGVFTQCPTCGHRVPRLDIVFLCPKCPIEHYRLMPTPRYGILYCKCKCGEKVPTTRFTGRTELQARCPLPDCGVSISAEEYRPMTIAFLGGTSVGKSMVHHVMSCKAEALFRKHNWGYKTNSDDAAMIAEMRNSLQRGDKLAATQDTGIVKALCIDLQDPASVFAKRLYLFDPPGELFTDAERIAAKDYYKGGIDFVPPLIYSGEIVAILPCVIRSVRRDQGLPQYHARVFSDVSR